MARRRTRVEDSCTLWTRFPQAEKIDVPSLLAHRARLPTTATLISTYSFYNIIYFVLALSAKAWRTNANYRPKGGGIKERNKER